MHSAHLPRPLRLGVAAWLAWAGGMFANVTQEETFMCGAAGPGLCASAITMALALGGPRARRKEKYREQTLTQTKALGLIPTPKGSKKKVLF